MREPVHLMWLSDLGRNDIGRVGGKNASLGEMIRALGSQGIEVPRGFATLSGAYRAFLALNGLEAVIGEWTRRWEAGEVELSEAGAAIRKAFLSGAWPPDVEGEIRDAYRLLSGRYGTAEADVAVRSSATAKDLPDASFAGQQESSFLNVRGEKALLDACRRCFASPGRS